MTDLIERQAAIAVANSSDYVGLSVDDVKKVTDEVVKGLKRLPPAQPDVPDICVGDMISRQAATKTALEFIVEYLGGAFDEDFQKELIEQMNALPSTQPDFDVTVKIDKAYDDGYKAGYLQGRHDCGDLDE